MNYKYISTLAFAFVSLALGSCHEDSPKGAAEVRDYVSLGVQLSSEASLINTLAGREVKITSASGQTYTAKTDNAGLATFSNIIPGEYTASTSWEMTGADYLTQTGTNVGETKYIFAGSLSKSLVTSGRTLTMDIVGNPKSELVISKIYASQTKVAGSNRAYAAATYIELYNNTDEVLDLSNYHLGVHDSYNRAVFTVADRDNLVYLLQAFRLPNVSLAARTTLVIAVSALDHSSSNNAEDPNLTVADYEIKEVRTRNGFTNNQSTPELPLVYSGINLPLNIVLTGSSVSLFKTTDNVASWALYNDRGETEGSGMQYRQMSTRYIVDAVDILAYGSREPFVSLDLKRFTKPFDAGYTYWQESREGIAVARRYTIDNGVVTLQDTNNSTEDFVQVKHLQPRTFTYPLQ